MSLFGVFFISVSSSKQFELEPVPICPNCTLWAEGRWHHFEPGTNITFGHWCREYDCKCVCGPDDMKCHNWLVSDQCGFRRGRFLKLREEGSAP